MILMFIISINGAQCILTDEYNLSIEYKGKTTDLNNLKPKIKCSDLALICTQIKHVNCL
jgi:hypothetical protein